MVPLYNYFTASVGLVLVALILYLVRRDHLSAGYTIGWFLIAVGMCILGLFPAITDWVGKTLDVHYPPILLVILACCFTLMKLLFMDIDRSRRDKKIRSLTQRLALYEAEVEQKQSVEVLKSSSDKKDSSMLS